MVFKSKLSVLEREMYEVIRENPGISPAEAARRVGAMAKSGSSVVWRLRACGLVKAAPKDMNDPRYGRCWVEDELDSSLFEPDEECRVDDSTA